MVISNESELELYGILGLDWRASEEDIKAAFKRLALQLHPDKTNTRGEEFKALGQAYAILSDPQRRKVYDAALLERIRASQGCNITSPRDQSELLWDAASRGHVAGVEDAYRRGGRVGWRHPGNNGRTALHAAARGGHVEMVRMLVRLGADIASKSAYKETALHECGSAETVRVLVQMGLNVGQENKYKATPLHCAAADGNLDVARALVELGAPLHAQNVYGMTPAQLASVRGHVTLCNYLMHCQQHGHSVIGTCYLETRMDTCVISNRAVLQDRPPPLNPQTRTSLERNNTSPRKGNETARPQYHVDEHAAPYPHKGASTKRDGTAVRANAPATALLEQPARASGGIWLWGEMTSNSDSPRKHAMHGSMRTPAPAHAVQNDQQKFAGFWEQSPMSGLETLSFAKLWESMAAHKFAPGSSQPHTVPEHNQAERPPPFDMFWEGKAAPQYVTEIPRAHTVPEISQAERPPPGEFNI